ncbi:MAG: hypothetical protein K0Q51_677 [Rickettsiaceae bacterium]|jgi:putative membrane protein insertion efficiency factor|nr:hypothetical protein [Rickettsiaceae bacterium]
MRVILSRIIISFIRFYQICLSPLIYKTCRFYPTCSNYAIEAVKEYGGVKGTFKSIIRILKCHPFHPGGYDPIKPTLKKD